jgi:hypothetical protein
VPRIGEFSPLDRGIVTAKPHRVPFRILETDHICHRCLPATDEWTAAAAQAFPTAALIAVNYGAFPTDIASFRPQVFAVRRAWPLPALNSCSVCARQGCFVFFTYSTLTELLDKRRVLQRREPARHPPTGSRRCIRGELCGAGGKSACVPDAETTINVGIDAEPSLKPRSAAEWHTIDEAIDRALDALRPAS